MAFSTRPFQNGPVSKNLGGGRYDPMGKTGGAQHLDAKSRINKSPKSPFGGGRHEPPMVQGNSAPGIPGAAPSGKPTGVPVKRVKQAGTRAR